MNYLVGWFKDRFKEAKTDAFIESIPDVPLPLDLEDEPSVGDYRISPENENSYVIERYGHPKGIHMARTFPYWNVWFDDVRQVGKTEQEAEEMIQKFIKRDKEEKDRILKHKKWLEENPPRRVPPYKYLKDDIDG